MTNKSAGFTFVEVLIALAITVLMLTSLATAIHGGLMAYAENERISALTQTARVALDQMMAHARTALGVEIGPQRLSIIPPANPDGVSAVAYELAGGVLYLRRTVAGVETSYPLAGADDGLQVEGFSVVRTTEKKGLIEYTLTVQVALSLRAGPNRMTFTASTSPRRNQTF